MADLRIVDAPEIPTNNITGEEKIPTGGNGNYSISLDSLADYTKTKKDLADNTSVDNKVSGVHQQLNTHTQNLSNPHQVTKGQIGLGNVDNTADADKPVSNATQAAIISAVTPKSDKTYVDSQLALKSNKADVYTKQESSDLVNNSISTALVPVNASLGLAKRGIANRYDSSLTYNLGERVILTNGDIVKSTVDGNTNDPNLNMTGWISTNTASSILDASGLSQQGINNLSLTPFHFGAVSDGLSHKLSERYTTLAAAQNIYPHAVSLDDEIDWCALQALNNYAVSLNNSRVKIDWSGNFFVNRTISYIVPTSQIGGYRTIEGDANFSIADNFIGDSLIVLHGRGVKHSGVIRANLRNIVKWGIKLADRENPQAANYISFGNSLGSLFISNAICHAVRFTGNAMFANVEFIRAELCGTGAASVGKVLTASVISHTNSKVGTLDSTSSIVVDTLPPVSVGDSTIIVKYGEFCSRVTAIDASTNTLTILPLLPIVVDTNVKLSYIFGGAVTTSGSDTAGASIKKITQIGCGIGIDHRAMYPLAINQFLSEFAGVSIYSGGLVSGVDIKERYVEGDTYLLVQNSTRKTDGVTNLEWGLNIDPSKIVDISYGRNADGSTMELFAGAQGLRLWNNNTQYYWKQGKLPNNVIPTGTWNGFGVDFNAPHEHKVYKATGNMTVGFIPINENYNRLFGLDSQEFTVFGTGLNGAPTGTITIPVLSGYTLNGGSTNLTFSGFNAAATFTFFLNVVAKDIQVSVSGANSYNLSVGTELSNGSNANDIAVNTNLWFRGTTTVTNLPTPTTGTKVDGNITTVFSVSQTGSAHNKTQVVEYVTLFEKWERVYSSGSGTYGAWKLISYEVKKGTTAQRPSNPVLGLRYYDTTLLAAGKPIEWNGVSWVDSTGATV